MEHPLSILGLQVERNRALPSVGESHREVHPTAVRADPLRGKTPVGIAVEAINADDVGTPVGQERTGHRDEDPLGEFDDPDAIERAVSHRRW